MSDLFDGRNQAAPSTACGQERPILTPYAIAGTGLTLVLLLSITLWMWWSTSADIRRTSRERFNTTLTQAQFAIGQRLGQLDVEPFAPSPLVTRDEWQAYANTLYGNKGLLGLQGFGYAEWVRPGQLAAHTLRIRDQGFHDYTVKPAGLRADYAPIIYRARSMRAFGYDLLSQPILREAMQRARDSGEPSISGKVKLIEDFGAMTPTGFFMFLPVYPKGTAPTSVEARRAVLLGYVFISFQVGSLIDGIIGPENLRKIRLRIFDGRVASPANLLYDGLDYDSKASSAPAFTKDQPFVFEGRDWILRFDSRPEFDASIETQKPQMILFGGLLISILGTVVVGSLALNRSRAQALADANAGLQDEIAERVKLEQALSLAKDAAEAANQAKSDFLANVSHELRTPLTLILAPLEQLLAAEQQDWRIQLQRAQRNARVLLNRVNEILDYAKAEAGKFELCWGQIDLVEFISVLGGDAATAAAGKQCELTWQVDPALKAVCLDARYFEKIAMNLLSNAIKFTPAGGSIQLAATLLDDDNFEFVVVDSGIGIPADKLPLLFQRFSQVDNSTTRHYGGTGIGLALVKDLAELMGGDITVESQPGQGSRFQVRLPRGAARLATLAPVEEAPTEFAPSVDIIAQRHLRFNEDRGLDTPCEPEDKRQRQERLSLPKVLVVDDSPDMLAYVCDLLGEDCNVVTAADGEEAWNLLLRYPFDLVVSDVMMPKLDGFGLTARIKANPTLSRLTVILLTARGGNEASVLGLEAGADDYIAKPFSPLELKARVHAALRMSRMQDELRAKSRQAGMAEIATNVLHNVGNILNSVNVSADLVCSRVRASKLQGLPRAVQLLEKHAANLGEFLTQDEKGKLLPSYLAKLAQALSIEQSEVLEELSNLVRSIDHIKDVVATQQTYAGASSVLEIVQITELLEDALRITGASLSRHAVTVVKAFSEVPRLRLDKSRVMQILVNLISNAENAMDAVTDRPHVLTLQTELVEGRSLKICISDQGEGIAAENLTRVFAHGFTTRKDGHGFGLHSCILAATEMGGSLTAFSDGPGTGAAFTLELPIILTEHLT